MGDDVHEYLTSSGVMDHVADVLISILETKQDNALRDFESSSFAVKQREKTAKHQHEKENEELHIITPVISVFAFCFLTPKEETR